MLRPGGAKQKKFRFGTHLKMSAVKKNVADFFPNVRAGRFSCHDARNTFFGQIVTGQLYLRRLPRAFDTFKGDESSQKQNLPRRFFNERKTGFFGLETIETRPSKRQNRGQIRLTIHPQF
jgi:hypothetical protein